MCAGRCREPRCIRSPCRGSQRLRRALGGTRILLAAAPTAPPCFCRWQRSSLLHRGFFTRRTIRRVDAVRIHPCSPFCKTDKTETPVPGSDTGVLGGRGWIARAALLKTAHWAVFTLSSATAPQLFESTLASPFSRQIKQKLQYPVRILESLVGAGGFEPPKLKAADLQSVPIGHSGTRPYLFLQSRGLPVYVTTESAICQPIIWAGRKKRRNKGREYKSPPARVRFTASGREGFSA